MIKISEIPIEKIKKITFYLFLSFLMISIFHDHNFDIGLNDETINSSASSSESIDHFIDSELNCVLHTFNNSISFEYLDQQISNDIKIQFFLNHKNYLLPSELYNITYQLRGPPNLLS